jgi:shikimate kinase
MAVGKSVVGQRLARRLKRPFVDLDQAIEEREGMEVQEIFSRKGEAYFREVEKRTLREILRQSGQVIATGGGVVVNEENLRLLKQRSLLVYLTASPEILLRRSGTGKERPLLKGGEGKKRIEELLRRREKAYAQAHVRIDTSCLSVDEVVEEITEALNQLTAPSPSSSPSRERNRKKIPSPSGRGRG